MYEYAFKRAGDHFETDFDVYRFNLYDGGEKGRSLIDCTLETHAKDLNTVLSAFASRYKKVFLIGHSYGGPTIMIANPEGVTASSLWDPSYDLTKIQTEFQHKGDSYLIDWGVSSLIGAKMYHESGTFDRESCARLAREFQAPIQVVHAADGLYVHDAESYHSHTSFESIREIVAGTEHCFYEGSSCDVLLEKTGKWFKRF